MNHLAMRSDRVEYMPPMVGPEYHDDAELVAECFGCPRCGERRMDYLAWNKAGTIVICESCGVDYDPNR